MRILQIINALTLGGAQFIMLDLARQARSNGCEVEVACFRDGPIGKTLRQEARIIGGNPHRPKIVISWLVVCP